MFQRANFLRVMTGLSLIALVPIAGCSEPGDGADTSTNTTPTAPAETEQSADMTDTTSNTRFPIDPALTPPQAERRPHTITQFGEERVDPYHWLRDDQWQDVLRDPTVLDGEIRTYLEAENTYYESATQDLAPLRDAIFEEMRGRIKEDDSSVPAKDGDYAYAVRFREGGEYPVYVRTPRDGGEETILLDGDKERGDSEFFSIGGVNHSPDHTMIAYGADRLGSEYYDIRIRIIETGADLSVTIPSTDGDAIWAADSKSLFYVERDDNQRPKRVKRHVLGTDPASDELIYEEEDDTYFLGIGESQSGAFLFITSSKSTSSEVRFLRADAPPGSEPELIAPRLEDQLYYAEHHDEHFYLQTNADGAVDFKIVRTPIAAPGRENW